MLRHIKDLVIGPPIADNLLVKPSSDELFYAKCLSVLAKPTARFWFAMRVLRMTYWSAMLCAFGWVCIQLFERVPPVEELSHTAEPFGVVAGSAVHVHYVIDRHKRCEVNIRWYTVDSKGVVTNYDPAVSFPGGPLGRSEYIWKYQTDPEMNSGPALLHVYKTYKCPGNYLSGIWPIPLTPYSVPFEVVSIRPPSASASAPAPGAHEPNSE